MEYKKSYKGFIIWIVLFFTVCIGVIFLPINNTDIIVRIVNNICSLSIACLAFIIYINEKIYWYNGITYEEALSAGTEQRKAYAFKHFKRLGIFAVAFLIFSVIAHVMEINFFIDLAIFTAGLIGVAISTIWIHL